MFFCLFLLLVLPLEADMTSYYKRVGAKWLAEMEKVEGVSKTASGLLYKVIKTGKGTVSPKVDTTCKVHYEGTLKDGTKFDSSYDRGEPTSFAPNQVIKGWTEALQMVHSGDKWELYIPSDLAYGERGSPPKIPQHSPLKFIIELISFKGDGVAKQAKKRSSGHSEL
eukprot:NODE_5966_length_588_cov_15.058568_g5801_i0.p1 GENE.NODE_5966_length_588_cov_15.058568_g5801_i0~~NODE_5966_length_588_cov_15.058568_g5801_i0.p1  ORF type:complete len:167 (-),score=35.54 NODE_5966_length_588_cov_15.058568_g5801_i0:45-545(-)